MGIFDYVILANIAVDLSIYGLLSYLSLIVGGVRTASGQRLVDAPIDEILSLFPMYLLRCAAPL